MNGTKKAPWAIVVLRILLGTFFIVSGTSKILRPEAIFEISIRAYQVVPEALVSPIAHTLPWLELVLGAYLQLGFLIPQVTAVLGSLALIFQIVIGQAIVRDLPIVSCGCFGGTFHPTMKVAFAMDMALLILLIVLGSFSRQPLSIDRRLGYGPEEPGDGASAG